MELFNYLVKCDILNKIPSSDRLMEFFNENIKSIQIEHIEDIFIVILNDNCTDTSIYKVTGGSTLRLQTSDIDFTKYQYSYHKVYEGTFTLLFSDYEDDPCTYMMHPITLILKYSLSKDIQEPISVFVPFGLVEDTC
jgi:hypothetical protein